MLKACVLRQDRIFAWLSDTVLPMRRIRGQRVFAEKNQPSLRRIALLGLPDDDGHQHADRADSDPGQPER
jgi:hypothetical protein